MKRWLLIFLTILILTTMPGMSLGENYSAYTLDQLEQLQREISLELFERQYGEDGLYLEDKAYLIGRDIPAGKYVFEATAEMETRFENNQDKIEIKIFASQKKYDQYRLGEAKSIKKKFALGKKDIGFPLEVELKKNEILLVEQEVNRAIVIRKTGKKKTGGEQKPAVTSASQAATPTPQAVTENAVEDNSKAEEYETVLDHYETVEVQRSRQVLDHYETYYTYQDNGDGTFVEVAHERPVYTTEYYTETVQQPVYIQVKKGE